MNENSDESELKVVQPGDEAIAAALRQLNYNPPGGEVAPETPPDPTVFEMLDINNYTEDQLEKIPIPENLLEDIAPPEKERVRNTAGGLFSGEGEVQTAKANPWSRKIESLGEVSVTPDEYDAYWRALLHDQRFEIPVHMFLGDQPVTVVCRSLYMSEREVIALAVDRIASSYPVKNMQTAAIISDFLFKCNIAVQVVSVDNISQNAFDATLEAGQLPEESDKVDELVKLARTRYGNTHQARMRMLAQACHTFEVKQQILEDGGYNRDFSQPGDAY